jgi:hypothetical protein
MLPLGRTLSQPSSQPTIIRLNGSLIDKDLPRYGLNLGGSGTWGAEHLRANVLGNPGFEPVLDRTLLVLKEASRGRMVDDTSWLARPNGFWDGSGFDIRSGKLAGTSGKVMTSIKRPSDGLAELLTDNVLDGLSSGDIVILTRKKDTQTAPLWWVGHGQVANTNETRPDSPGQQAVRLLATPGAPAEILHFLDNITDRAGKLLLVNGKWSLSFWARTQKLGSSMHLYYGRSGSSPFLNITIQPGSKWKRYQFDFNANDNGVPAVLTLSMTALDGEVLLDDVYLGETNASSGGFRQTVVETLKTLKPGYLRDWQGQLGDLLSNRISGEFAHQPVRYRPGENEIQFHYGLSDFFELCAAVGARPWVVAPTTMSDAEWRDIGAYLRQAADKHKFDEILVEFGNENWNQIFRPGGIPDSATHAAVADRAFRLMKQGAGADKRIISVVNSQFVNPDSPRNVGAAAQEANRVAVAPYILNKLDDHQDRESAYQAAFEEKTDLLQKEAVTAKNQHKQLAVYEVNFHTTWGNADKKLRNEVVTGAASGPALARRLMQATMAEVREQCIYLLSGFDTYVSDSKDLVHLWGITRDLTVPNNFRPTGLALSMLNSAAGGKTFSTNCEGEYCTDLTAVAYAGGNRLAIVSARAESIPIKVKLSCQSRTVNLKLLNGSTPALNNEEETQVKVQSSSLNCQSDEVSFRLPGHSLGVLTQ